MDFFANMQNDIPEVGQSVVAQAIALFKEGCKKCNGSGQWIPSFGYGGARRCFSCNGRGYHEFKTPTAQRALNRERAAAKKERVATEALDSFKSEFPAEYEWMVASAARFDFAQSMLDAVRKYGSLTERQLEAVQKCLAKSAERAAERQQRAESAPTVSIEAIETAFNNAKSAGIQHPKLRLDTFVFSPAPKTGKNPDAIYVKEDGQYLGKVLNGKLFAVRECSEDAQKRILEVASDPASAAVAYGKKFGSCAVCARTLTDPESIERGIGPICAGRFGW